MRTHLVALLLVVCGPLHAFGSRTEDASPAKPAAAPIFERVAVIGASISSGFGHSDAFDLSDPPVRGFDKVIDASILVPHQPPSVQASSMFFVSAESTGAGYLAKLKETKPTMIVGIDFLFWYGYGAGPAAARVPRLKAALAQLEAFDVPLLVSDFPDMTPATRAPRPMLMPEQVPDAQTLKQLNETLRAWAAEHKNVVIVPLAAMTAKLHADEAFEVRGNKFEKGSAARLMIADQLHTNVEGSAALWVLALDTLLKARPEIPASAVETNVAKLTALASAKLAASAASAPKRQKAKPVGDVKKLEKQPN
jgi:hypothetical protein